MLSVDDILKATKGKLIQGEKSALIRGVSINSRMVRRGDVFVAIKGNNFDGHDFLSQAIKKSAAALVVAKDVSLKNKKIPVIVVADTTKALGHLARFYRDQFKIPVIAITGSVGKTTTKEMVAAVLGKQYPVLKNVATENNQIGVPLTLFKLNKSHKAVVVELGTNHFGEIRWLTHIANPTMAILINIGESHLEFLKSPEGVFKEKFDLVKGMKTKGEVIFNADDTYLSSIPSKKPKHRLIRFGVHTDGHYQATDIKINQDSKLEFNVEGKQSFLLNTSGVHNVYNALAAISCARRFKVPYKKIQKTLQTFKFPPGRLSILKTELYTIIDDTYNANPISFKGAVDALVNFHTPRRKILICGDMFELGKEANRLHEEVGKLIAKAPIDLLLTVGKLSTVVSTTAKENNQHLETYHFSSIDPAYKRLKSYLNKDDVLLIKGSRGMRMERFIDLIKREKKG